MAPFLLASLLYKRVLLSGAGRIVLAGDVIRGCGDSLNDLHGAREWDALKAYKRSKLCDAMIALEMGLRYSYPPQLVVHCLDPGLVSTRLLRLQMSRTGYPAYTADLAFKTLTNEQAGNKNIFMRGDEIDNARQRAQLWQKLVNLTGAVWP